MRLRVGFVLYTFAVALHTSAAPVGRYEIHEIQFAGPADPTATIDGTFTHVSGKKIVMPAFWDGGTSWRCRFAPTELGRWTYAVAGQEGEVACVGGGNPGFIHADGRHFRRDDGSYVHVLGNTHYDLMRCSEGVIDQYVAWDRGSFNKVRMAVVTQRYHGEDKAFEPGGDEDGYDFHKPVPAYWQKLDRTVAKLQKAGIIADLILAGPDITYRQLRDDFYTRYIVARYAAYSNVWWCMGNEIHSKGKYTPAEVTAAAQFIRKLDPYNHPRSVHEQAKWMYADQTWPTHVIFQLKRGTVAEQRKLMLLVRDLGIPVINDEPAYQGEMTDGGDIRAYWGCVIGCGYASGGQKPANKKGPYFPDRDLPPDAFKNPRSERGWYVRQQAAILQSFMSRTQWWEMNNVADLGGGCFVRCEPGRQYLVIVAPGKTATLDLSAAKGRDLPVVFYDIQATDARTAVKALPSTGGAASIELAAGASEERVYLVGGK